MYLTLHTQLVGELQNLKQIQEWLMWKKIQNFYILCYSPHAAQNISKKLRYKDDEFGSLDKMSYKNLRKLKIFSLVTFYISFYIIIMQHFKWNTENMILWMAR